VRLRRLKEELGDGLAIQWKAFPLRPEPDPFVAFKGTYREEAWRRCGAMAEPDGIRFSPWPRDDYPDCSLPALEAAKCVARQGAEPFERLHLRLYEAFFTRHVNIARPDELVEVVRESGADMTRFLADFESGTARESVLADYRDALTRDGVRAIPTILVEGGRRLTGLADLPAYRKAVEEVSGG
jgi:predicted DsbA family dithiol-disulfide isomerase